MPELPEVEVARRSLDLTIAGRRIAAADIVKPQALRSHRPPQAARILVGQTIRGVARRGKALLFHLDGGWVLTFQFALWGLVRVVEEAVPDAMTAVVLRLDDGRAIEFRELQLSSLNLYPAADFDRVPFFASMGICGHRRSCSRPACGRAGRPRRWGTTRGAGCTDRRGLYCGGACGPEASPSSPTRPDAGGAIGWPCTGAAGSRAASVEAESPPAVSAADRSRTAHRARSRREANEPSHADAR
jgi:hypothetical protein